MGAGGRACRGFTPSPDLLSRAGPRGNQARPRRRQPAAPPSPAISPAPAMQQAAPGPRHGARGLRETRLSQESHGARHERAGGSHPAGPGGFPGGESASLSRWNLQPRAPACGSLRGEICLEDMGGAEWGAQHLGGQRRVPRADPLRRPHLRAPRPSSAQLWASFLSLVTDGNLGTAVTVR